MDAEETEKQHVMYLWLISQDVNRHRDTYDAAVVCAASVSDAMHINPWTPHAWCDTAAVKVRLLGIAEDDAKPGVILASFNAG